MLRSYVEESRFIVTTDHQSLKWIHKLKRSVGRLVRLHLRLVELYFEVHHRPERKHKAENVLPRQPTNQTDDSDFDNCLPPYSIVDHHFEPHEHNMKEQKMLAIQQFIAG